MFKKKLTFCVFTTGSLRDTELVFVWSQPNGGVEVNPEFSPMDFTLAAVATSPSPLSRPSFSGIKLSKFELVTFA